MLNASARSCRRERRAEEHVLHQGDVHVLIGRTLQEVARRIPEAAERRNENAPVLNHCSGVMLLETVGSPVTLGRSLHSKPRFERPVLLTSMVGSTATVNGRPLQNPRWQDHLQIHL